ncbi:MAG: efflux RND transporter periplasmic adaptor subunit [Thiohalomonadales bacterium]
MRKFKLLPRKLLLLIILMSSITIVEAKDIKAKLTWFNVTKLSFRVNGIIANILVKPGDHIKIKQKLIYLDQREFTDNVKLTNSLQISRKSDLNEAKRELDRSIELFDRTVLSEHELQIVKNDFIVSETRYVTANINWLKSKRDLEFSNIVAPFNAIVLELFVNKYETVISSFKASPAIVIAAADKIAATFMLNADDVSKLKENELVEVEIKGSIYKGKLFFPSLLTTDTLYPVSALISIPYGSVRSGMDVIVKIK